MALIAVLGAETEPESFHLHSVSRLQTDKDTAHYSMWLALRALLQCTRCSSIIFFFLCNAISLCQKKKLMN